MRLSCRWAGYLFTFVHLSIIKTLHIFKHKVGDQTINIRNAEHELESQKKNQEIVLNFCGNRNTGGKFMHITFSERKLLSEIKNTPYYLT